MAEFPKRVLVTGVSSFVGYHLARTFAGRGAKVTGVISRPPESVTGIRAGRLAALGPDITLAAADLCDGQAVTGLIAAASPGLVVHHAGHALGYASPDYDLPGSLAVNVCALDALYRALEGRCGGVIITGSSAEYSCSDAANRESDACAPDTPYGLSKLMETLRARQLAGRYQVPTRVARLYIPFGRLDHPDKLLSQVITRLSQGQPIALSDCTQARDFVGAGDVCEAWVCLARDMPRTLFDVMNICSGEATVLRDLLLTVAARLGADPKLLEFGRYPMRPGEGAVSFGSNGKARDVLGWVPTPLTQAIERDLLGSAS